MNRGMRWVLAAGVLLLLVGGGVWLARGGAKQDSTASLPESKTPLTTPSAAGVQPGVKSVLPAAVTPPSRATFAHAGWGHGPNELGRDRPKEGNPEAPMSLTTDANGNTLVLDQVNGRIVKYDRAGKAKGSIPLTVQSAQDLQVAKDGTTVVLDRLTDRSIALVDPEGHLRGELKVEGKNITEGGAVTGLIVDGNDVYLEREHGDLVRVGDTAGNADPERPEIPGRPTKDGKAYVSAGITDAQAGKVFINSVDRATKEHRYTRELTLGQPVSAITFLDSNLAGTVYMGLLLNSPVDPKAPDAVPTFSLHLVCLDPADGRPLGQTILPVNTLADETFRDLAISEPAGVTYSFRTEAGVELQHYDCR